MTVYSWPTRTWSRTNCETTPPSIAFTVHANRVPSGALIEYARLTTAPSMVKRWVKYWPARNRIGRESVDSTTNVTASAVSRHTSTTRT